MWVVPESLTGENRKFAESESGINKHEGTSDEWEKPPDQQERAKHQTMRRQQPRSSEGVLFVDVAILNILVMGILQTKTDKFLQNFTFSVTQIGTNQKPYFYTCAGLVLITI